MKSPIVGQNFGSIICEEAINIEPHMASVSFGGSLPDLQDARKSYPTVARFSLVGHSPRLTESILLAERIHAALVELSNGSPIFTGCDGLGKPLTGHSHAYILSESNMGLGRGKDGEITHVTVYSSAGFSLKEQAALERLREVCGSGINVQLSLMGMGYPEDFGGLELDRGKSPLLGESRRWISRTPFIPTRHPKVTRAGVPKCDESGLQIGSPEHELRRLLALAGFPDPAKIESLAGAILGMQEIPWEGFRCRRENGRGRRTSYDVGHGFRVDFAEAVKGPIAVGYGAHFGLGGFKVGEIR